MIYCPKCGTQMPEGAKFCMKCGQLVGIQAPQGFLLAAMILIIIAAMLVLLCGIIYISYSMTALLRESEPYYPYTYSYYNFGIESLILGILCIVGFSLGILSGVLSHGKKNFNYAIICSLIIIVVAALTIITPYRQFGGFVNTLGLVSLILSILGTAFLAISREEFSDKI